MMNNMEDMNMQRTNEGMCVIDKCKCNCKFEFEPKMDVDAESDLTREEMEKKLKCYRFAIIELGLYLDTHPDDEKAICLHKEYANKFKVLEDKYQKVYGPLSIMYPCNKWRWLEEPWHTLNLEYPKMSFDNYGLIVYKL